MILLSRYLKKDFKSAKARDGRLLWSRGMKWNSDVADLRGTSVGRIFRAARSKRRKGLQQGFQSQIQRRENILLGNAELRSFENFSFERCLNLDALVSVVSSEMTVTAGKFLSK